MAKKIHKITIQQAIDGHLQYCQAQTFSPNTIADYQNTFRLFLAHLNDPTIPIHQITIHHIETFLQQMSNEHITPNHGVTANATTTAPAKRRKPKTILNYHIALSSLWTYAVKRQFAREHVVSAIPAPRVPETPIEPLTAANIAALFHACGESRPWRNKPLTTNYRTTAVRDKAILAIFTDTALRCQELCDLTIGNISLHKRGGEVVVEEGKGRKRRTVPFGGQCATFVHDWVVIRGETDPNQPFFVNQLGRSKGQPMTRDVVGRLIKRLGKKAGIDNTNVGPHLLRTTAACMMAANGITAIELQRIMGHESVETTMRYIRAAQIDMAEAMRRASPLNNLRL